MTKYLDNEGLTHFTGKMKEYADGKAGEVDSKVTTHVGNKQNPHGVTKAQVGLSKVINETQIPSNQKGFANGVATLDANGKIPVAQMPTTKTINGASIFGSGNLQLSASLYKIVDKLPTTGIDTSKIYLVPAESFTTNNYKTEYIYLGDPNKAYDESKWEKIGDEKTNNITPTPGGSITVDTAFNATSSNPIANKTVTKKFGVVDDALKAKVAQETYDAKMATIDSKLKTLENKTIDVDAELGDTSNPVQNRAVNAAVLNLNTEIGKKANSSDLNAATGKITTLETNAATKVIETGEGNGISGISKSGNIITATKGNFLTSAAGLATTAALNDGLAKKADVNHNHDTTYAAKKHTHPEYAQSSALNDYVTKTALDGKNFLTATSLNGYVNEVQPDGTQSGNGIANITKDGKVLKVTKATFLTEHQSLADYATKTWVGDQGFAIGTIPTKVSDLTNDSGYLVDTVKKSHFNELYIEESPVSNGIADIWIDNTNKKELCVRKAKFVKPENLETAINNYASNQGYLTKEDMKETVVIKLVSDKSASDTNLNGAKVTVKSGDTTVSTQTWQGTPIKVEVPCDKEVTIEAAVVKMYMKPQVLKYVPSPLYNREVTFTYKALSLGTYIIDTNNNFTDRDSWDGNEDTVVGVALITEKVAIVIPAGSKYPLMWSEQKQLVEGATVANTVSDAMGDFNGKANTEAIVSTLGTKAGAAYYCYNYTFKNGKKGYLMSAGEAQEMLLNRSSIGILLNAIDSSSVNFEEGCKYWTSTQSASGIIWILEDAITQTVCNHTGPYTIPIYSLYD
jgi:hypothetical protein